MLARHGVRICSPFVRCSGAPLLLVEQLCVIDLLPLSICASLGLRHCPTVSRNDNSSRCSQLAVALGHYFKRPTVQLSKSASRHCLAWWLHGLGVNAQGQPTHTERVGKFDGADVPVQAVQPPSQAATTSAFRRVDTRSFEVVNKSAGKLTSTVRVVISADGKTMTQTSNGTNAQGQKTDSISVYDKQ